VLVAGSFRYDRPGACRETAGGRVSWPLASFLVITVVLAVGWVAYERSRPSARMTAVVAVMAAIAALGRDAFAALPDVKPITAITLVVGYSLGPLPGFTVGAIGMLVSNFMFGQGSYTPWQMAAWGMVGLTGGALGKLSSRRLGRLPLALACAATALCAKEVMNLYTWTLGATHTPAAFVLVAGAGLPFDVTDTVASFLFGLAFAPELAGMLARTRMRMEVTWDPVPADADASPPEPAPSGLAHPAAVTSAVTGTDLGGLAFAAGDFNATTPRNRFAVALTPGRDVPLPEEVP
jgi:energy-coupling factor transport system substrate-specific component